MLDASQLQQAWSRKRAALRVRVNPTRARIAQTLQMALSPRQRLRPELVVMFCVLVTLDSSRR